MSKNLYFEIFQGIEQYSMWGYMSEQALDVARFTGSTDAQTIGTVLMADRGEEAEKFEGQSTIYWAEAYRFGGNPLAFTTHSVHFHKVEAERARAMECLRTGLLSRLSWYATLEKSFTSSFATPRTM